MKPQLIVIDSPEDIDTLTQYLADKEFIAYDCETTGLTTRHEVIGFSVCAEEGKAYYVVLAKWNKAENKLAYIQYNLERSRILIQSLVGKNLIAHNAVFDCMMAEAYFKVRLIDSIHTDTMILAHLLDENRRVGLKELGYTLFGESSTEEQKEMRASVSANGGLLTKDHYEMFKADSELLGRYGAKDAWLTYKLFIALVPDLYEQGLDSFFYDEESMPLLRGPTYDLNTTGLQTDLKALTTLKKTLQAECLEAKDFIYQEIAAHIKDKYPGTKKANTFNIGASQQLSWLVFGKLGLEFGTLTKGGKTVCKELGLKLPYTYAAKKSFIATCEIRKDEVWQPEAKVNGKLVRSKKVKDPWAYIACDKETLKKLAPKHKWIQRLLEYQRKTKLLNTYVEGIEERVQYGVLHPSFLQHGTVTGRYSSRNPNLQNLPREDQRVKDCFVARQGKVFVSADYSQLEPRVFAYYSKDQRLMSAFNGETDFYSVVGMEVYAKYDCTPQKDGSDEAFGVKYKRFRDLSKVIALASAYGATPAKLATTTGKSIEDTSNDMETYFERFPGVKTMMLDAHTLVKEHGYVTNIFGRKRRIPEAKRITKLYGRIAHEDLPYDARKLLNMACNQRIQGTGASLINRAAIKLYSDLKELNIKAKLVSQIHDELVVECDVQDAENISLLLQNAMENTNLLEGVPLEAIPRISNTLSK